QRSGDRHQPTSQQSSHRSHGQNNDRHRSDRRGGNDNHRSSNNNNYSSSNNSFVITYIPGSSGLRRFFRYAMFIYSFYLCYVLSLYPFTERYAQPYFFSCLIRQTFKTLCLLDYALMIHHDYDITSSLRRGALQLWYQSQTLFPKIRAEIREEFPTSSGPSDAGGNPPPATIHTWLERFNKQKPHSFEKATAPIDAKNWISHMEKIFDVMGCEDAFKTRLAVYKFEDFKKLFFLQFFPRAEQERLKREYHSIRQTSTETSKPFEEERPTTPKPAWSILSDVPVLTNNWASALASNYSPPPEDSLLVQTGDIATTTPVCLVITYIPGSSGLRRFFRYTMFLYSCYLCYFMSLYPFTKRYAQPYFFSCFDTAEGRYTTTPSSSKIAASAEYKAWTTTDIKLKPSVSSTPEDLHIDDDMASDAQPLEEGRPATPEHAWSIPSSDLPILKNNWASSLASTYSPPPEDSLLAQTGDMAMFMNWFYKRQGITKLKPQDLEGPALNLLKSSILMHNVSKPLPLGGPLGQVTIQSDFFFNKDLEYLRYDSKEQMVPDQMWIEEECKYDIAAIAVRTHMWILSVVRIEVFSMSGYDYMKKIVLRRADLNEHIITKQDFKYLYPSDFENLYLLNLQGHLNHLPPNVKKILTTAVNLWTRHLVIRQRVEDFQLGIKS
nr:hypothetical protein [Tanacetum cinerariifolium]